MLSKHINVADYLDRSDNVSIGVLSDTHGIVSQSVLQILNNCELILHAGDICGQRVLDQLREISQHVIAVGGNNDKSFSYDAITPPDVTLPDVVHIKFATGTISLLHGHQFGMAQPDHDAMRREFADSRCIIYGHTHRQVHETSGMPWVLNPGAAGETRTNGGASCAQIMIADDGWAVSLHK